ncbi:hypothetical protein H072_8597 [Dactylellina haptotyla CBS 200.50]|uniref:GEgh 16 protein n=1 Tax=Dactylellina haptotyla (strain CBS 200.50) TaxID=1284197 RepID=S8A4M6_DACHA|nr:hypothetical protein H072_8597 [Dactylellina haptotyla CBS 200.50]
MHSKLILSVVFASIISQVQSHGLITVAVGNGGGPVGKGLGVDPSVPRTGTAPNPFQVDTTVFANQRSVAAAKGCGSTAKGGVNDVAAQVNAMAAANQIPTIAPGGELRMTLHQVNADGAGPYICMVDTTGTGNNFVPLMVSQQVAGTDGNNDARPASTNALFAKFAPATRCTGTFGGKTGVCMVRCQNNSTAGPFGGCVPVQIVDPAQQAAAAKAAEAAKTKAAANAAAKDAAAKAKVAAKNANGGGAAAAKDVPVAAAKDVAVPAPVPKVGVPTARNATTPFNGTAPAGAKPAAEKPDAEKRAPVPVPIAVKPRISSRAAPAPEVAPKGRRVKRFTA